MESRAELLLALLATKADRVELDPHLSTHCCSSGYMAQSRAMRCTFFAILLLAALGSSVQATADRDTAKDQSASSLVMFWPSQDKAILKLTFGHFQNLATYGSQMTLVSTVLVQNVSPNLVPKSSFSVSLLDKERVRVGSGTLVIERIERGRFRQSPVSMRILGSAFCDFGCRAQQ
jgi:hypothetical protein